QFMHAPHSVNCNFNENRNLILEEQKTPHPTKHSLFQMEQKSKSIFSGFDCSRNIAKELALENCIELIKNIPFFSTEQRANWYSWYNLHSLALQTLKITIPGIRDDSIISLPWHPMQIRLDQYIVNSYLRTSCGVSNRIVLSILLGAKKAAYQVNYGKTKQLNQLELILKSKVPALLTFKIKACKLTIDKDNHIRYKGHIWTVFQATPERYLLLSSYIAQQDCTMTELNREEMLEHILDIELISTTEVWSSEVDATYRKWFNVSHPELLDQIFAENTPQAPWKVTFNSIEPDIQTVKKIQEQFSKALQVPYFPSAMIINEGDSLSLDEQKIKKLIDHKGIKYISEAVSSKKAIYDYMRY
nr:hypothetical protein [Parachlamydiaceae bacterium]